MKSEKNIKKTSRTTTRNLKREAILREFLANLGEDVGRDGLVETPKRVAKMYDELLSGYTQDPRDVLKLFDGNGFSQMVTVTNIDFYSLCEHHMIPFFGKVHIGYVPNGKVLGLSKFARLVEVFSRRLQTQENITNQIAEALAKYAKPRGVIVYVEAEHLCVSMRGIKKKGFITKTMAKKGVFEKKPELVDQFFRDIYMSKGGTNDSH